MGRSSHRRRADAQRKQQRIHDRAHAGPSGTDPAGRYGSADAAPADGQSPLADAAMTSLVLTAATLACGPRADKVDFAVAVQALTDLETGPATAGRTTATIAELLDRYLGHLFEGGWQPADVAHAVKREWNVTASRLAVAAIAAASRRTDAATRAPQPWLAQLDDLGAYDAARGAIVGGQADYLARWARAQRLHPDEA
ncbi:MAG: hypothetical protein JWM12_2690, partial [Ilumatobacteraceae bacterium]|nr:hypothetical protein [Ilumatobacteraceae bacterium]